MADRMSARSLLRAMVDDHGRRAVEGRSDGEDELARSEIALRDLPEPWSLGEGSGVRSEDPLGWPGYRDRLVDVRTTAGADESVLAARGTIGGHDAILVAWEFAFLGGSMGLDAGERIARAYDEARRERLPVVLFPSTGGARMQEGMVSLVQMAKTVVAARAHAAAGLLQIAVLRDPTTGGVFASHVSLADVILAQPGATIGFAGPRVAEAMTGGPLPEGSHTAEGAVAAGLADAVVEDDQIRAWLGPLVAWAHDVTAPAGDVHDGDAEDEAVADGDGAPSAWEEVQRARAPDRPRASAYLDGLSIAVELHGDRAGGDDGSIRVVLASLGGRRIVAVAMDRESPGEGRVTPAGYRKAWRGIEIADRLEVPLVTFVDTPGADASASSEAGGVANHIARTFQRMLAARCPTVCLVIGEGGSGGALALAVSDRLLIQEHAVFSVIAPEGAAAILEHEGLSPEEVSGRLRPTSRDLLDLGIADEVVAEPDGAAVRVALDAVSRHIGDVSRHGAEERLDRRLRRWRQAGNPRRAATR